MTGLGVGHDMRDVDACEVRDVGADAAMDAYRAESAAASVAELAGGGRAAYHVRQAALEAVIAERMRINAVISIHRAVLAGASAGELAHVLGVSRAEITERWRGWADQQRRLNVECSPLGVGEGEYSQVAAVLRADDEFVDCACSRGEKRK